MIYILGLADIVLAVLIAKNRRNIAAVLKYVAVFDVISLALMMELVSGENVVINTFAALQVGTLNSDFSDVLNAVQDKTLFFKILYYLLVILCPILCGGFILSFFDSIIQGLFLKSIRKRRDNYYFSELNDHSLMLAESICENNPKALIVFFNYDGNEDLKEEAIKNNFIVLNTELENIVFKSSRQISYFFINEKQSENVPAGLKLLELCKNSKELQSFSNMKMYIFSDETDSEDILNSTDKKGFLVYLLNKNEVIVNNLIFTKPFYKNMGNSHEISILVAGSNTIAREIVRSAVWACQFGSEYKFSVTVIDEHASKLQTQLQYECPEYFNPKWHYQLAFYDAAIQSPEFEKVLLEHCVNTTYAAVCVDDDSLAIQTALYLRRFFIRTDSEYKKEPFITVQIRSREKYIAATELTAVNKEKISLKGWDIYSPKSENYNIVPFGCDDEIYCYENIVHNTTLNLALNCHTAYQYMFGDGTPIASEKLTESFNYNEIDKKSNRANGIHLKYKLHLLGYDLIDYSDATEEEIGAADAVLAEIKKKLSDDVLMDYLGRVEHDRWTAFQSSQGWRSVPVEDARRYSANTGSHKHLKAKLHPCICTYEELDEIIKIFDPHLKEYDVEFVKKMTEILGLEPGSCNITDIRFICKPVER